MKKSAWLRLALILVCAAMMLSLFACGGGEVAETEGSSKAPDTEAVEKPTESEKAEESETETDVVTDAETETKVETDSEAKTETTAPKADTEETETKEATTEKTVVTTETEKKPVETTEKEKPTETKEKETEPVEPDPLDVFVKADALANATVNSGRIEKGVLSSDGKYVTFANKADGADGWMLGYTGGSVVSGQYLVIKYRFPVSNQTKATTIEIFCSTANAGPTGGDNVQLPVIADGEWHIGIVDMAKSKGAEKFPANSDGTYTIKYARFDVLNGSHKVGDTVDVAYVGIDNSLADALALVKAEGMKSAYVNVGYTAYETYYASTGTTTPAPADVVNVFVTPDTLVGASVNASRFSGKELSADGSYVTFTANGTGGDGYALLYSGGTTVSGQYIVFKYRYHAENAYKATYIETFISCTNGGPAAGDNLRFDVVSDGEWHITVVDASALLKNFAANEDGTYTVKYARFDIFDSGSHGEGDKIDIAYVGLTDSIDDVVTANRDVKKIYHKLGNEAEKKYTIYTSTGTTEPGMTDVANKYFDAEYLAGKAPSGTNIGKVELSEDKSYVSIYGKGAADGFFSVFGGNTDVTGQYIIMKYRYVAAEGASFKPTARPLFSGNVYAGPTGDDTTGSFPIVADGEWHMTVFDLSAHLKDTVFVANEDGTYAVKYLRFDIADNLPEDCAFDIAYIALTDDVNDLISVAKGEGLETVTVRLDRDLGTQTYYTATGTTEPPVDDDETGTEGEGEETETEIETETETETQTEGEIVEVNPDEEQGDVDYDAPFFQFNIDYINDARSAGRGGVNAMYKDFAPYSTSADGIIDLKGWFFGISGVASYEFSIDGGATWITLPDTATNYTYGSDPNGIDKLIINKNTQLLGTPGFGVNANFRGGASLKINLSHLAHDEKVSITISAVLNSGDRVEFLKLLDVFVACTHEDNTSAWTAIEGDIQRLASTCSACGKGVTKFIDYTTENLKLAGAGHLASKKTNDASKIATSLRQEANGMYYAHFEITTAFHNENTLTVWSGSTIENVDKFVAFLYRTNSNTVGTEMFISADSSLNGSHQNYPPIVVGGWQLSIVDCTSKTVWTKETGVYQLRLDLFNSRTAADPYKKGDYADIAYLAFFSSKDAAIDFYATYVDTYLGAENCAHARVSSDWQWTGVEGEYKQKTTCLLCNGNVVRDCPHAAVAGEWVGTDTVGKITAPCASCGYDVVMDCDHPASFATYTAVEGDLYSQNVKCTRCAFENVATGITSEGKKLFTPEEIAAMLHNGNFKKELVTDSETGMKYVHAEMTVNSLEGTLTLGDGNTTITGVAPYVAILYKRNATGGNNNLQCYFNSAGKKDHVGAYSPNAGITNDNTWHLKVVSLTSASQLDLNVGLGWTRFDIFDADSNKIGDKLDIAYIGFFSSEDAANNFYKSYASVYTAACDHSNNENAPVQDPNNPQKVITECSICQYKGESYPTVTDKGLLLFGPEFIKAKVGANASVVTDANGMKYVRIKSSKTSGEEHVHLISSSTPYTNIGKYVAVLYRSSVDQKIEVVCDSTSTGVRSGVQYLGKRNTGDVWTYVVHSNGTHANFDGQNLTAFRFDYHDLPRTLDDTTDVVFIAFFATEADAYAYFAKYVNAFDDSVGCPHVSDNVWTQTNTEDGIVHVGTHCTICNTVIESFTGKGNTTADSCGGYLDAKKDGEVVRYTPTKSVADTYFYPYRYGDVVTGKYMIIKYRLVNDGKNMTVSTPFASSAASGQTGAAGSNGDASNTIIAGASDDTARFDIYADGNWHYIIVTPNSGNATFTANADGTYSWAYLRMRLNGFAAYDGSCYFEIDEVVFADNLVAAEKYACTNETKMFIVNLDKGNCDIDGAAFMETAFVPAAPVVIDLTGKTLDTASSLKLGGWVCTPGGVASYKYRVVSVDGAPVADPALVNWASAANRGDIYTVIGSKRGYSDTCSKGAGMNKTAFDFSAYAGKTINLEVVATTNYGMEIVVVKVNNIAVPAAE